MLITNRFTAKPGKPEGPLEVSDIHKEGCKLKWKKPKDDGGEPIECYSVEKYDADSGMWLPVGKTKDPEMEVLGLVPGHEYEFRVKAVNKEGESEPLETMAPIIAKDPFSKFTWTIFDYYIHFFHKLFFKTEEYISNRYV